MTSRIQALNLGFEVLRDSPCTSDATDYHNSQQLPISNHSRTVDVRVASQYREETRVGESSHDPVKQGQTVIENE
jgi:hypothetical protein